MIDWTRVARDLSEPAPSLHLFSGFGIELEYMVVDRETLAVKPIADHLLRVGDRFETEVEHDDIAWSNELVLHVIEVKTNGPASSLGGLASVFQQHVMEINRLLEPLGAKLMPTAMHPTMNPDAEMRLWPHEYNPIYETFHRIFDCRGHGWANLQSAHINLPFADDAEFARLHAAVRVLLPLIPALAASSPIVDGQLTGLLDTRLEVYRTNARRIPSVSGLVIPEVARSQREYEETILEPLYDDLAPLDPEGVLRYEWVNARGAIARFDRNTIEIRVIDVQECPLADLAIAIATVETLRALCDGRIGDLDAANRLETSALAAVLRATSKTAEDAVIRDRAYLDLFGLTNQGPVTAGDVWRHLVSTTLHDGPTGHDWRNALSIIADEGCLARRIAGRLGNDPDPQRLHAVYEELCDCLASGKLLRASSPMLT